MIGSLARRIAGPLAAATAAVSVLLVPATASAEPTTGTVAGVITRPDGSPAAGEVVFVERYESTSFSRSVTTDAAGAYSVADVPAGDGYRVGVNRAPGRQYAHGKTDYGLADAFTVAGGGTTTVDERLLPVGTFTLTLTEWNGGPARGAAVALVDPATNYYAFGSTDAAGEATLSVFAGSFRVSVTPTFSSGPGVNFARVQFLPGQVDEDGATPVVVAPDGVTAVTERLLQPGGLAVSARDAVTGAPVSGFCVTHTAGGDCTDGAGPVAVTEVRPGPFSLSVSANGGGYLPADPSPVVVAGQTVPVTVDLRPAGQAAVTIVAADTGAPLASACVALVRAGTAVLPDGTGDCTDAAGNLTVGRIEPGDYHVFVQAPHGSGYGAQWVGRSGGVGTATRAATVRVTAGATVTVPTIRLDRAGTVSGVVASETGAPVTGGTVSLHAFGRAGPSFSVEIDGSGRYSIDWLGPYEWPLLFGTAGHARQWSGNEADRRRARTVRVVAGQTTAYSPTLRVGTVLTGGVTDAAGQPLTAEFDLVNAGTGEQTGAGYSPGGTYRTLVLGPQDVKLSWFVGERDGWYRNASDFASATRIAIPRRGTKTLDLVLPV